MATIRIAEQLRPAWEGESSSRDGVGGVYPMRQRRFALPGRAMSFDKRSLKSAASAGRDAEDEDEDPNIRQDGDYKSKQVCSDA